MSSPEDVRRLAGQLAAGLNPDQQQALLDAVLADRATGFLENALRVPEPEVGAVPARVRGFRVRLDLVGATPPVWRRVELAGDLTLDRVHEVIQAAMGWLDGHLHRFRTGSDHRSPYFLTPFDVEEGEDGVPEEGVRLDQVLGGPGERLWYSYDFGDGWEHVLAVEAVTDTPPGGVRCTGGRRACPPEDCGGIWAYTELAAWVRGGCDPATVPSPFEDATHAHDWLPLGWHPDHFDADATDLTVRASLATPAPVPAELAALAGELERRGDWTLSQMLARAAASPAAPEVGAAPVDAAAAARLLAPFVVLLDVIGAGVRLTSAGHLPPVVVTELAERTGISTWWIGATNREDLTAPVAQLRRSARVLGLVSVRHGRLAPTASGQRHRGQPLALWRHVVSRLPLGNTEFDRQAGWLSVAVAAAATPTEQWTQEIRALLLTLGWRTTTTTTGVDSGSLRDHVAVTNPTLDVLLLLAGQIHRGRLTGPDAAVAATARAVIAPTGR